MLRSPTPSGERQILNYRHAFHAGNFADLVKHAALLEVLRLMAGSPGPLTVIDTHAGRGLYDLDGVEAKKSGEARDGVLRLLADDAAPAAYGRLVMAVRAANPKAGPIAVYPGSPWLIARALRPGDAYIACELRPEEHAALRRTLGARPGVQALCADGYEIAAARCPTEGKVLVLIDPPFERPDDYHRLVEAVDLVHAANPAAVVMIWMPLKDLETFDGVLRDLEDLDAGRLLVAETRLRPLADPLKMNGCALVFLGAPQGLEVVLEPVCAWPPAVRGEGGQGRVWRT
jgi:23S rRNA (adenine2030-N6)-methyltransferase